MSASSSRIDVLVYYGGEISQDGWSVTYDRNPVGLVRISRSATYSDFLSRLYQKIRIDSSEYVLKVFAKYSCQYMDRIKETLIQIEDDDTLSDFFDPTVGYPMMEVYVEKEQIQHDANSQLMSQQWGEYMSLLANQGLPSFNHDVFAGASASVPEDYTPDIGRVTQGLDNIGIHSNSYNENDEECEHDEPVDDPEADSFATFEDQYSEPDEAEFPIPPPEPENDVDVNVMAETLAPNPEGTSSSHQTPTDVETDQMFYPSIPYFARTFPEIPADSIDVPNLKYAKFYTSNEGKLDVGMVFKNKEHLICAVKDHSIRHARREYVVVESTKSLWKVVCKHSTPDMWCRWVLRGIKKAKIGRWVITKYGGDHTCLMNDMSLEHCNLDRSFVASLLLGQVKCDPTYGIKNVIQTVKDQLGYDVSYPKAWYGLRMAREIIFGTWESSVRRLPRYLGALQKWNEGTIVEWEHKSFQRSTGAYVLKYVFWAFQPCIEGFQFCRKVISVDGTHLYTKYKHKMLIAAAMDGNQQVLPLAFAIVDEESYLSWKWFLQMVSKHIIRGISGMCLISDRHPGLMSAISDIPDFVPPRGVHRYCLRHVCSNFNKHFNNVQLKDLCWRAGSEYQVRKFDRTMNEIKSIKMEAFMYLDQIEKEKWTASHDGGWRCGILTTNMSECINGVLKGARRLPVTAIVEITFDRSVFYFRERMAKSSVMLNNNQLWTDYAYRLFKRWSEKSVEHVVTRFDQFQQSASVITKRYHGQGYNTHVVKIATRECSCGKWTEVGIPCSHAQKVCAAYRLNAASMVKQYYDLMPYRMTYSKSFNPLMAEDYWETPEFELIHDTTLRVTTRPGRQQTTRIPNEMDWPQARARQQIRSQQQSQASTSQPNVPRRGRRRHNNEATS